MRVIKMLGVALLGCAAFLSTVANAQTPVSCNWASIGTENPPNYNITIVYHQCKQTNGTLIANRQLITNKTTGAVQQCTLTPESGYTYSGSCLNPSFSTQSPIVTPTSSCTTPGVQVHGGCANSYNPSFLTNPTYLSRCGTGCTLEYQSQGWTSACPPGNAGSSPQYGLFCK